MTKIDRNPELVYYNMANSAILKKTRTFLFLTGVLLVACSEETPLFPSFCLGIMSGEATASTIILQTRLCYPDSFDLSDPVGFEAEGLFEWSQDPDFTSVKSSDVTLADGGNDYLLKATVTALLPGTRYFYRPIAIIGKHRVRGPVGSFTTNGDEYTIEPISLAVVTGMNYYHFHYGKYDSTKAYRGPDKDLGYPAISTITKMKPTYFIGTGDNVYYDHPARGGYERALERGLTPHPGGYGGRGVSTIAGMRKKWHEQFIQPRFLQLFQSTPTYWLKDDHDHRYNDSDPYADMPIRHQDGLDVFREQLPYPYAEQKPYRTHRLSRDLQIWLVEGREFRSANNDPDGPLKTIWGKEQLAWLKETLLASDATFKVLVSATPMVGPDDAYKKDNHTNPQGFRYEGEQFFNWLRENDFDDQNFYIVCGDRHWQYHAMHPSGIEEFSTGALVDNNARPGRIAGDPQSTDPEAFIVQHYVQSESEDVTGGFLHLSVTPQAHAAEANFRFYDEKGKLLYKSLKSALRDEE